jgi:hypothetical protein
VEWNSETGESALLTTFVDESDQGNNQGVFVVAGYAAHRPTWEPITEAWNRVLEHTPRLAYYKTHSFRDPKWLSENGWSEHQAATKTRHLMQVLEDAKSTILFSIYVSVRKSDFHEACKVAPRLYKELRNPYQWSFARLVSASLRKLQQLRICGDVMDFAIDSEGAVTETAQAIIKGIRPLLPDREMAEILGDAKPDDDKKVPALQMADMLAGHVKDYLTAEVDADRRKRLERILARENIQIKIAKDELEDYLASEPVQ